MSLKCLQRGAINYRDTALKLIPIRNQISGQISEQLYYDACASIIDSRNESGNPHLINDLFQVIDDRYPLIEEVRQKEFLEVANILGELSFYSDCHPDVYDDAEENLKESYLKGRAKARAETKWGLNGLFLASIASLATLAVAVMAHAPAVLLVLLVVPFIPHTNQWLGKQMSQCFPNFFNREFRNKVEPGWDRPTPALSPA